MNKQLTHRVYRNKNFERPFDSRLPLHITLHSDVARGELSMATNRMRKWIRAYVPGLAMRLGVTLYHASNNGNHLHLVGKFPSKEILNTFLRTVTGMIARRTLKAEKGKKAKLKFWTQRPYSRLISWGKEFRNVILYVHRNVLESRGRISYISRDRTLTTGLAEFIKQSWALEKTAIERFFTGQIAFDIL